MLQVSDIRDHSSSFPLNVFCYVIVCNKEETPYQISVLYKGQTIDL